MSKKKKKSRIKPAEIAQILAGIGTLLLGIAAMIQTLR